MPPLQIPKFSTLEKPASWLNAKGSIDRSACIEIRISELRQLAGCYAKRCSKRGGTWRVVGETSPLPREQRARNTHGRVASGIITVSARSLAMLQDVRRPRTLAGDWRTQRANAMRNETWRPDPECRGGKGFRTRITRKDPVVWPFDRGLEGNPNKGASRTKQIGLYADWQQEIRVEKWIFPKRIQPAYYMICPGAHGLDAIVPQRREDGGMLIPPPRLSNCGAGRKDPKTKKCPQRCLKLLMVQCTRQENRDALSAQLWINSIPHNHIRHYRAEIAQLYNRYGPVMEPRILLCPRCLRVKYGNHPETVRQGWRRRNMKPDTRLCASIEPAVRQRMAEVPAVLCTPLVGRIELRARELLRYRRYNRKRKRRREMVRSGEWAKFTGQDPTKPMRVRGLGSKPVMSGPDPAKKKSKKQGRKRARKR